MFSSPSSSCRNKIALTRMVVIEVVGGHPEHFNPFILLNFNSCNSIVGYFSLLIYNHSVIEINGRIAFKCHQHSSHVPQLWIRSEEGTIRI